MKLTATLYAPPIIALALMLAYLPGAHTTLAAAWHAIDPSRLPGEWHAALFLAVAVVVLGAVVRGKYYVAGWWK